MAQRAIARLVNQRRSRSGTRGRRHLVDQFRGIGVDLVDEIGRRADLENHRVFVFADTEFGPDVLTVITNPPAKPAQFPRSSLIRNARQLMDVANEVDPEIVMACCSRHCSYLPTAPAHQSKPPCVAMT